MDRSAAFGVNNITAMVADPTSGYVYFSTSMGDVYKWNAETGSTALSARVGTNLTSLALSPDHTYLVAGEANGTTDLPLRFEKIAVSDLSSTTIQLPLSTTYPVSFFDSYRYGVYSLAVIPGDKVIYNASYALSGFTEVGVFSVSNPAGVNYSGGSSSLSAGWMFSSENNRYVVVADQYYSPSSIYVYDTLTGITSQTPFNTLRGAVYGSVSISEPTGLIAYDDGALRVLDLTGHLVRQITDYYSGGYIASATAFLPGGHQLLAWDTTNNLLRAYDTQTWAQVGAFTMPAWGGGGASTGPDMFVGDNGQFLYLEGNRQSIDLTAKLSLTVTGTGGNDALYGATGADTISGLAGDDTIDGGGGGDVLDGGAGSNMISFARATSGVVLDLTSQSSNTGATLSNFQSALGSPYNDSLVGSAGANSLFGGAGDDTLVGGQGADTLSGGDGNDRLVGGDGASSLSGGAGADTLIGGAGADTLLGGDGNDSLVGGGGADSLSGGLGNDTLSCASGAATLDGGDGDDRLISGGDSSSLSGGAGADTLIGGLGADTLSGGDGGDSLAGGGAADTLAGGLGDDTLSAGSGDATLDGGAGHDLIIGGAGADRIVIGLGESGVQAGHIDTVQNWNSSDKLQFANSASIPDDFTTATATDYASALATANADIHDQGYKFVAVAVGSDVVVFADSGNDRGVADDAVLLQGRALADVAAANIVAQPAAPLMASLTGGAGADTLVGGQGADTLSGGDGGDSLVGGGGADTLAGGLGDDTLSCGSGDATLNGGAGHDLIIIGGAGADRIVIGLGESGVQAGHIDTIQNWNSSDTLQFANSATTPDNFTTATATDYASALAQANTAIDVHGYKFVAVAVGSDVVVFADSGNDRGVAEDAVLLQGRALADISAANIVAQPAAPLIDTTPPPPPPPPPPPVVTPAPSSPPTTITPTSSAPTAPPEPSAPSAGGDGAHGTVVGNMDVAHLADFLPAVLTQASGTEVAASGPGGLGFVLTGSGFSYDNNQLVGGSATHLTLTDVANGATILQQNLSLPGTDVSNFEFWLANNQTQTAFQTILAHGDQLVGGASGDLIRGYGGSDLISGGGGNDSLYGGDGNDVISAVSGPAGSTWLRGEAGDDYIMGGGGFDNVNGNQGNDTLDGGTGGNDWLLGGQGNDMIFVHSGNNILNGNMGDDSIVGGSGHDSLRGGQGADVIWAGSGGDWITGDRGNDTLVAGQGADTFYLPRGGGQDRVFSFDPAHDHVQLDAGTTYQATQVGADVLVDIGQGDAITLANVQLSALPAGWITA